jgi:hypothetical protein
MAMAVSAVPLETPQLVSGPASTHLPGASSHGAVRGTGVSPQPVQVGHVEELLQLGGGEGPFHWPRVVGLNVTRPIELGDELRTTVPNSRPQCSFHS